MISVADVTFRQEIIKLAVTFRVLAWM